MALRLPASALRFALSALAVALGLACGLGPDPAGGPAAAPVPVQTAPSDAPTTAPPLPPAAELPVGQAPPVQVDMVALFERDCHALVPIGEEAALDNMAGENAPTADRCEELWFDQNCGPDPSGCWSDGYACKRACPQPCVACRDACAGSCDGCKSACAPGDPGCMRACAEARAACYTGCLAAKATCEDRTCVAQEQACESAYSTRVESECGTACGARQACVSEHAFEEGGLDRCAKEFPVPMGFCESACAIVQS